MDSEVQAEAQPIGFMALDCDKLFDKCLNRFEETDIQSYVSEISEFIEEYHDRFDGWATFMGVFARYEACLDYRVRKHPELQDMFVRFLDVLRRNLFLVSIYKLPDDPRGSMSKSGDNSTDSLMAEQLPQIFYSAFDAIRESTIRLNKLGISVRSSTKTLHVVRARKFAAQNPELVPLGEFEEKTYLVLFSLYPNAPESLRRQLADAMTDRYAKLQYESYRNKLAKHVPDRAPEVTETETQDSRSEKGTPLTMTPKPSLEPAAPAQDMKYIKIELPASSINSRYLPRYLLPNFEDSSTQSKPSRTLTVRETSFREPPRPKFRTRLSKQCQWCFQTIDKLLVQKKENGIVMWSTEGRRHYMQDLQPYVCIAEGCRESRPTFSSSSEWYGHMMSTHSQYWAQDIHKEPVWECPAEHENESIYNFATHEELLDHISLHNHESPLTTAPQDHQRPASACPLCLFSVEGNNSTILKDSGASVTPTLSHRDKHVKLKPEPAAEERRATTWAMGAHIADHLYHLMLVSLPLMTSMDYPKVEEDDDDSVVAATGSDLSEADEVGWRRDLADLPFELQGPISWSEASAEWQRIQGLLNNVDASPIEIEEVEAELVEGRKFGASDPRVKKKPAEPAANSAEIDDDELERMVLEMEEAEAVREKEEAEHAKQVGLENVEKKTEEEAAAIQQEVLEKRKRILGEEYPDTIAAMSNLVATLGDQGQLEEAAAILQKVLEETKCILGEDHPDTISAMNNLAIILRDQGQLEEAVAIRQEVLEKRKRILGEEHPDTISAMNNLAITLRYQCRLEEAAAMLQEVLEKRKRILGEEHPDTISAMNNLAAILSDQGQLEEAAAIRQEVLEKRRRNILSKSTSKRRDNK